MTSRAYYLVALLVLTPVVVWVASLQPETFSDFWTTRRALMPFTGLLAIILMSAAIMLAARPIQIETFLGGLDKYYALHKWLAIAGTLLAILHWLLEIVPRFLVKHGWLERKARPGGGGGGAEEAGAFDWDGLATGLGEWALYALLLLVALALWKRFPYRWFIKTHRLLALVFLVLVFHAIVLMPDSYWAGGLGFIAAIPIAGGAAAAAMSLFGRIGHSRKASGHIDALHFDDDNSVLDVDVHLQTAWPGHAPGQFAFVDFGGGEGSHPFTIASSWRHDGHLKFSIKSLGDYTRRLPHTLFVEQAVTIEGPYGRFDFAAGRPRQIWIAGGIGITPFLARLQHLAQQGGTSPVDLIYSTDHPSPAFIENVQNLAGQAGVRFHLLVPPREGPLTLERLETMVPDWQEAEVWFCGPPAFGNALLAAMQSRNFPAERFHREYFKIR